MKKVLILSCIILSRVLFHCLQVHSRYSQVDVPWKFPVKSAVLRWKGTHSHINISKKGAYAFLPYVISHPEITYGNKTIRLDGIVHNYRDHPFVNVLFYILYKMRKSTGCILPTFHLVQEGGEMFLILLVGWNVM